ncbi:phosphoglucosamine mutase [Actinobacteria bacterium YIM 96077]|uniref:Phosphoglucosamine mutase n=1 Tax=Phytoactinopolyspora halophila TaxID=1981511 RepID=A0A329QGT9_9ACTN|nr:phosphoglucosamine mutase [Phytoactinopolyspora halophila]AYY14702.1 phosphoglucosamine mutase [Actinobacteria bacterium YIM 96077]RAW11587.1 phosphoglucosamine mutase [Phytoactinopolyspora halophila]
MARLFGTDGVRGRANIDLTAELALDLSVAAVHVLTEAGAFSTGRPTAVVGRDTRVSGEFLESAVSAGLASAGLDVLRVGVLPTPAVAFLTDRLGADLGVMLSASHNPMPDNGVKFFNKGGHKIDDALEDAIEARLREPWNRPTGADVGRIRDFPEAQETYIDHIVGSAPHRLDGLKVVVDCAHGAAFVVAPEVLRRLGAEVVAIAADPDGTNINDRCGSTHIETLVDAVQEHGADAGVAHDGDADRCLAVDSRGKVVDGDQILAILALAMQERGALRHDTVVATVMSNEGMRLAMRSAGLTVVDTAVGDRYVLEAMKGGGYSLGGEQSGHIVMLDHGTTGDGVQTATHLLAHVAAGDRSLDELAAVVQPLPQILVNVSGVDKARVTTDEAIRMAVASAEEELMGTGRVLLRPSGTEPVVRVMVEASTADQADTIARRLAHVVEASLAH